MVVVDNLSSHKGSQTRRIIEAAGARPLFLPLYSPDLSPIERAFSKLKIRLQNAAERTVDGLWTTIGQISQTFTPDQCANCFAAAGYKPI